VHYLLKWLVERVEDISAWRKAIPSSRSLKINLWSASERTVYPFGKKISAGQIPKRSKEYDFV
jgi:hypothetical protein